MRGIDISDKKPKALTSEMQEAAEIGVVVCGELRPENARDLHAELLKILEAE